MLNFKCQKPKFWNLKLTEIFLRARFRWLCMLGEESGQWEPEVLWGWNVLIVFRLYLVFSWEAAAGGEWADHGNQCRQFPSQKTKTSLEIEESFAQKVKQSSLTDNNLVENFGSSWSLKAAHWLDGKQVCQTRIRTWEGSTTRWSSEEGPPMATCGQVTEEPQARTNPCQ